MKRQVTLYCKGRDVQYFHLPRTNLSETVHHIAHQLRNDRDRPFAVDVLVNGKVLQPTLENRRRNPGLSTGIVLVQNCSHDVLAIPNRSWCVR